MSLLPLKIVREDDPTTVFALSSRRANSSVVDVPNLAGTTVELYIKTSQEQMNSDVGVIKYSTGTGQISVVAPPETSGQVVVNWSHGDIATHKFYRLDIITSGRRLTYAYGPVEIVMA